jgi:hypothetical protein
MSNTTTAPEATTTDVAEPAKAKRTRKSTTVAKAVEAMANADKAAPAKATKPAVAKVASTKLKWSVVGERDAKNRVEQHAEAADGTTYSITGSDKTWTLTVTRKGGKPEVVKEGSHGSCYAAAVAHAKSA